MLGGDLMAGQLHCIQQGVGVIIGTPGRLIDLPTKYDIELDGVSILVLDEVDCMLQRGFHEQKMHFMPPVVVFVGSRLGADLLSQAVTVTTGVKAISIHGEKPMKERREILRSFLVGEVPVIVATGVLGRGVDLLGVRQVIVFDMPNSIKEYVHQIGRASRLGEEGTAIVFVNEENKKIFQGWARRKGSTVSKVSGAVYSHWRMEIFLRNKNGRCGLTRFIGHSLVALSLNQTPHVLFKVIVTDHETLANHIASIVKIGDSVKFLWLSNIFELGIPSTAMLQSLLECVNVILHFELLKRRRKRNICSLCYSVVRLPPLTDELYLSSTVTLRVIYLCSDQLKDHVLSSVDSTCA
ncbi:unnamed protein product [Camellia sinensis]